MLEYYTFPRAITLTRNQTFECRFNVHWIYLVVALPNAMTVDIRLVITKETFICTIQTLDRKHEVRLCPHTPLGSDIWKLTTVNA